MCATVCARACVCNEEFALFAISERVVDTSRNLLKCVGGVGVGGFVYTFPPLLGPKD